MTAPAFTDTKLPFRRKVTKTAAQRVHMIFPGDGYKRQLIRAYVVAGRHGLTDYEAGFFLGPGVAWSTAGATRHALNRGQEHGIEWIEDTDETRLSATGNQCTVHRLTPAARTLLGLHW